MICTVAQLCQNNLYKTAEKWDHTIFYAKIHATQISRVIMNSFNSTKMAHSATLFSNSHYYSKHLVSINHYFFMNQERNFFSQNNNYQTSVTKTYKSLDKIVSRRASIIARDVKSKLCALWIRIHRTIENVYPKTGSCEHGNQTLVCNFTIFFFFSSSTMTMKKGR